MRKVVIGSLLLGAALLGSTDTFADGGLVLQPQPPVHVSAFSFPAQRVAVPGQKPKYTGGPIDLLVTVANTGTTAAKNVTVKLHYGGQGGGELTTTIANIAPKGTATAAFTDPKGLDSLCRPRNYDVFLSGEGISEHSMGEVVPSCTFTSKIVDPWNQATPDQVQYATSTSTYLTNAELAAAPTCASGPTVKAVIINHTKLSSPSLLVQAFSKDPSTGKEVVRLQTPAAFPLPPGEAKSIVLSPYGQPDMTDVMELKIVDWTQSLKGNLRNQGIEIKTTKSCTLTAGIPERQSIATVPK